MAPSSPTHPEKPGSCLRCGVALDGGGVAKVCPRCALGDLLTGDPSDGSASELKLDDLTAGSASPEYIGDYELDGVVAQGGMGVVYRARQRRLGRTVALKLLLGGVHASPDFRKRFQQEAEMAARLQHPNIVPIYEVGEHDGLPYFTMEYIDGPDLGTVSRERPVEPKAAAAQVASVARGIAYAHEQGVLHRDLKPSNILLGPDGRPRITDFGLARRLDAGSSLTMTGELLGTPGFLPPEQAAIQQGAIGVWSDIYSLGAVLYHLLAGRPPFVAGNLNEAIRQVLEQDPLPPRQLNPSIPEDLETICLKCLEKSPSRRYRTAVEVAEDLERFRTNRPIQARPPSRVYRLRKLVQRHRWAVTAATLLLVILTAGLATSTTLYLRERDALGRAQRAEQDQARQRARAEAEAAKNREVARFLQGMFRGVEDDAAAGKDTRLLQGILDSAAKRIDQDLKGDPDVQLELVATLAESYGSLGLDRESEALTRKAIEANGRRTNVAPLALARLHGQRAMTLVAMGRPEEAESFARSALKIRSEHLPEDAPEVGDALEKVAMVLAARELYDEAEKLERIALAINRKQGTNHIEALSDSLGCMARIQRGMGKTVEAEALLRESLQLRRAAHGPAHPLVFRILHNLATVRMDQGDAREAEELERQAYEIALQTYGRNSPLTAQVLGNLGKTFEMRGRRTEAESYFREALQLQQQAFGDAHPNVFLALNNLAGCLLGQNKLREAERLYARALESVSKFDIKPRDIEEGRRLRAWCLAGLGRWNEALALTSLPAGTNASGVAVTGSHFARGMFQARHQQWKEAAESMRQAVASSPEGHFHRCLLAPILAQLGDDAAYRAHCRDLLDRYADSDNHVIAHRVSKFVSLLALPNEDCERAARLAGRLKGNNKQPDLDWWSAGKALCDYRLGAFNSAVEATTRLLTTAELPVRLKPQVQFLHAMAAWQIGRTNDGVAAFHAGTASLHQELRRGTGADLGNDWAEVVVAWLLMKESQRLLRIEPALANAEDGRPGKSADVGLSPTIAGRWVPGRLLVERYEEVLGHTVRFLTNAPGFPDTPTSVGVTGAFETHEALPPDSGVRLSGFLIPPTSGEYFFYMAAEEEGVLFLSPDDQPERKAWLTTGRSPGPGKRWPARPPSGRTNGVSAAVNLVAGKRYYVEALAKPNRTPGRLAVAWQMPGEAPPSQTSTPIPGEYLGFIDRDPQPRSSPAAVTVNEGESVRLSVGLRSGLFSEVAWEMNWLTLPDQSRAILDTPPLRRTDSGARFRCLLRSPTIPGIVVSEETVVTVTPDTRPPQLLHATSVAGSNVVWVAFDERLDELKVRGPAAYAVDGIAPNTAKLSPEGTVVVLAFPEPLPVGARLAVGGLADRNGNSMAPAADVPIDFTSWVGKSIRPAISPVYTNRTYFSVGTNGFDLIMESGHCRPLAKGDDLLLVCQQLAGDFDLSARIARIDPIGCFASAGIMVRQSLAADSDYIFAHATPLEGNKWSGATVTDTKDGRRSARPLPNVPAKWVYPVSIPNEWLRIRRSGNEFTVLRSTDGARWQSLWSIPFDAGESVFAGFTGHGESRPRVGYAMFRDIRLTRPANGRRWSAGESVP